MIQIDHIISCIDGLHARPAAELANIASEYAIEVYINKDGKIANIKNITEVVGLCAKYGQKISILINGDNEKKSLKTIKKYIEENKRDFPYLGGNKICNYWLYIMEKYTDVSFTDRENITVAPDTHVIQASARLGIISPEEIKSSDVQLIVAERWKELLEGTEWVPIDIHTPMWLWSRGKFQIEL